MRFLLLFFILGGSLCAQLAWETRVLDLGASPKDDYVEGTFRFKNSGNYTVTILKTETSCGCTSGKLTKKVYAPGESGELVERYKVGWSRGFHQTGLTVVTDDASCPKTLVGMRIMIERSAEIAPEVLWWKLGSPPSKQEATIKVVRATPLNLISAETSTPGWTVKLAPVVPGWEYRVQIAPADLSREQSAVVIIKPESSDPNPQFFRIRARVK
jgi:hypothetical protein